MSDGDFQREGREYLPFVFEGELIEPEQYIAWRSMGEEYEIYQQLEEYESNNN